MKNLNSIFVVTFLFLISIVSYAQETSTKHTGFVNPFIGTGAVDANSLSGNNFPGATTPFGFVQLSPDTKDIPDDPCSGYDYYNKTIFGFSHTHLSGTGVPDLFDVLVMPDTGIFHNTDGYHSRFSHEQEMAKPGYYQVVLQDCNINAELTATEHVGFHRYTFPKSTQAHILIDMNHSFYKNRSWYPCRILAQLKVINNKTIEGYRIITGWAEGYRKVYFTAEFSKPFGGNVMINDRNTFENSSLINGNAVKIVLNFNTSANEQILMKVGLSAVSIENARLNLSTEVPDWDFDQIAEKALSQWEKELGCIDIEGTKEQKEIFYTGLYHAFIQPNNIADVNGDYPATDMAVRNAPTRNIIQPFRCGIHIEPQTLYTLLYNPSVPLILLIA